MAEQFDSIVVGAGTAGCLLANRLSADPTHRVLLLEAGGADDYLWVKIPVGYLYCIGNPRTDWLFETRAEPGLNGRSIKYPRGRVLGGCSSINGMIYMRGQREDYARWAADNPGWGWDDVLPYYRRHEDYHRLDDGSQDPLHGHGGEWRVEKQRLRWEILEAFRDAASQVGIPPVEDFNRGDNFGCGYFEVNQRKGTRWNAARGFLAPVRHRPNLTIVTGAHVERLLLEGADRLQVCGLRYLKVDGRDARKQQVQATIEVRGRVLLAAGSIGSVQILERSGIGDPDVLTAAGISPRHVLRGVGANLQDHLQLRTVFKVHGVKTLNKQANSLFGKMTMGLEYVVRRTGPLTMAPSQLGAFARSSDDYATANVEYHVQPLSLDKFGDPLHRFPAFTASVCNLRPSSRGSVHVGGADPFAKPVIAPNYLSTDEDLRVAADSIRLTRRIASAQALARYQPEEILPGPAFSTDEELYKAVGNIGTTIFHPAGTCRMGPDGDPGAVVDSRLRVHGIDGLMIADASVMPTITSGNTNSPTLMIAERAAEWARSASSG
ncbi:MAG: GMC family oxidoreductase [Burkholderiaceae bacterium]